MQTKMGVQCSGLIENKNTGEQRKHRMKTWLKLMLSFSAVVVLVITTGFMSIKIAQDKMKTNIGQNHHALAAGLLNDIDRNIYIRIETLQEYCQESVLQKMIAKSNQEFDKLNNVQAYINERDRQWTSLAPGQLSPFMKELMDNELSNELLEKIKFFGEKYQYPVFGEIFITNKYGANAALTRKTSDYYQADENWWKLAKEKGLHVEDVDYDDSAEIYSLNLCIRIDDEEGDFIGVIKAALNVQDPLSIAKDNFAKCGQENHSHGPHHGNLTRLSNSGKKLCYVEIKLRNNNNDKADIELWTSHDKDFTQPFGLPLDSVIRLDFLGEYSRSIELKVRDTVKNVDQYGHSNIHNSQASYFIFPGQTAVDTSWLAGFDFRAPIRAQITHDGKTYNSNTFVLIPHNHENYNCPNNRKTTQFQLITQNGKIIYGTEEHEFLDDIPKTIFSRLRTESEGGATFIIEEQKTGEKTRLLSWADSTGYRQYRGLGWILLIAEDTDEIFSPVVTLRNILLIILCTFTVIALIIGLLISYSISKPLEKLTEAMRRLGKGKLGTRVFIRTKNEFGILAGSLNKMASDLQRAQAQQVQNEKLTSIGQLAAGVAHEMNTPVGFVASNFQTLESYIKKIRGLVTMYEEFIEQLETLEKEELQNKTKDIGQYRNETKIDFILEDLSGLFSDSKEGLDRVTTIIQSLRDFSRIDQAGSRDEYDLNKGLEATLIVAGNEIKYDADVTTEFSELPKIYCHSGQINQVFLNILVNAAHAIKSQKRKDRGTITVKTYKSDDGKVVCQISDNGPGISNDNISRIFDPFFTTKPVGKGTGLGLSVSYDIIVNKHKGSLIVDSKVGKGTTFTIKLPIGTKENKENKEKEKAENGKANSVIR
jgi:signal transduction histidine kinase